MGVIKPPWVSKRWFAQYPFNYCDHFGNIEMLVTVCKICKSELLRKKQYEKAGQDPYDIKNVMRDVGDDLSRTMMTVRRKAKEMEVDLNNLEDIEESPPPETYPIYNKVVTYGKKIEKFLNNFTEVPIDANIEMTEIATDVFGHSRFYIIAKTVRALSSRFEEEKDPDDDLNDSKTSALFAYVAIERNSRAFLALVEHKPLSSMKRSFLKLAKESFEVCTAIRKEFFPKEKIVYDEFGCDYFKGIPSKNSTN